MEPVLTYGVVYSGFIEHLTRYPCLGPHVNQQLLFLYGECCHTAVNVLKTTCSDMAQTRTILQVTCDTNWSWF